MYQDFFKFPLQGGIAHRDICIGSQYATDEWEMKDANMQSGQGVFYIWSTIQQLLTELDGWGKHHVMLSK